MIRDYLIVGAGSAGCVLANHLSADGERSVALLEAGGPDTAPDIRVPARFTDLFHTEIDWGYRTTPQPGLNGRREYIPRGKVYGGTSSINAMVYARGHPSDYDRWAAAGNAGWRYAELLPLFRDMQRQQRGASAHHGADGPLHVSDPPDPNPLSLAFVAAAGQVGQPLRDDFNAGEQEGFGLYQTTTVDGQRWSAADAFLRPALERDNFEACPWSLVTELLFDGERCVGLRWQRDGATQEAFARREVILCGGAINSPQLLLLSGIGPPEQLQRCGIPLRHALPGVGRNLMDHVQVPVAWHCLEPVSLVAKEEPAQRALYREERRGLLSSNLGEAGGFVRLNPASPAPELQYHFGPGWFIRHGFGDPPGHGFTALTGLVATQSVGALALDPDNPQGPPLIDLACLTDERDLQVLLAGVRLAREIVAAPAFDRYRGEEFLPGAEVQDEAGLRHFLREFATTIYHPVGSCKMGQDEQAVVDERLRLRGLRGLRVADASIMPRIINANTNAPCMMIGAKAAAMIMEDEGTP